MILLIELGDADAAKVFAAIPDGVVVRGADCRTWADAVVVCRAYAAQDAAVPPATVVDPPANAG